MIAPDLAALAVPVDGLDSLPGNPRRGDVEAVSRSYAKFGQRKPVVARRVGGRGVVLAGNHQLAAARQLGWSEIAVVWVDDDDETAAAFALADNRTAELGGYDDPALAALLSSVEDAELLAATGWSPEAISDLLAGMEPTQLPPALSDPDDAPEAPAAPISAFGDLWLLGPHRLLCGDSTNPDHLAMVTDGIDPGIVYTDPPYGIAIVSGAGKVGTNVGSPFGGQVGGSKPFGSTKSKVIKTTEYMPVAGDDTTDVARDAFTLLIASYPLARHVWWGGNHYASSAGLPDSSCWLIWDKENTGNFADAELAWTNHDGAVRLLRHMWNGMLRATERGKRVHPTQKPVALAEWAFGVIDKDASRRTVLDVFGGSGSTLIAAHSTGRTAMVIEMEPSYVDVICRRYQEHAGTKPTRDGVAYDFTEEKRCEEPEAGDPKSPPKSAGTATRRRKTRSSSTPTTV